MKKPMLKTAIISWPLLALSSLMIASDNCQQYLIPPLIPHQHNRPAWNRLGTLWFMKSHFHGSSLERQTSAMHRRGNQFTESTKVRIRGQKEGHPALYRTSSSVESRRRTKDTHKLYGTNACENHLGSLSAKLTLARYNSQKYKRRQQRHENASPRARTAPCRLSRASTIVGSILPSETYRRTEYRSPFKKYDVPSTPSHPLRQMTSITCLNSSSSGEESSISHSVVTNQHSPKLYMTTLRPSDISRPKLCNVSHQERSVSCCSLTKSAAVNGIYSTLLTGESMTKQVKSAKPSQRKLWSNFKKRLLKRS